MTADRPATKPLLDMLREHLFTRGFDHPGHWSLTNEGARAIAEAAQGAAPRAEAKALLDRIMDEWDRDEAIAGIAAALAAPRAEGHHNHDGCNPYDEAHITGKSGLDVPTFLRGLANERGYIKTSLDNALDEFARLSRPPDERVPEGEEPR